MTSTSPTGSWHGNDWCSSHAVVSPVRCCGCGWSHCGCGSPCGIPVTCSHHPDSDLLTASSSADVVTSADAVTQVDTLSGESMDEVTSVTGLVTAASDDAVDVVTVVMTCVTVGVMHLTIQVTSATNMVIVDRMAQESTVEYFEVASYAH